MHFVPVIDEDFLRSCDLGELDDADKESLLASVRAQLEHRVGVRLSEGMDDAALEEFERLMERSGDAVAEWVAEHRPDYREHPAYVTLQSVMAIGATHDDVLAEFAANQWLEVNRPDYRDVVAREFDLLRDELRRNADRILAECGHRTAG